MTNSTDLQIEKLKSRALEILQIESNSVGGLISELKIELIDISDKLYALGEKLPDNLAKNDDDPLRLKQGANADGGVTLTRVEKKPELATAKDHTVHVVGCPALEASPRCTCPAVAPIDNPTSPLFAEVVAPALNTVTTFTDGDIDVLLEEHTSGALRVTYGAEVIDNLNYSDALREFGKCVFHSLACAGKFNVADGDEFLDQIEGDAD